MLQMVIMEEVATEMPVEFNDTGRTGRRNALPDVLDIDDKADPDTLVRKLDQMSIGNYFCAQ